MLETNEQQRQSSIQSEVDGRQFLQLFGIEPEPELMCHYGKSFNKLCSFSQQPSSSSSLSSSSSALSSLNLHNRTLTLFTIVCFAYLISEAAFCLPQNSFISMGTTTLAGKENAVKTALTMNKLFQNSSDSRSKTESLTLSLPFNGQSMAVFRSKRNVPDLEATSNINSKSDSEMDSERKHNATFDSLCHTFMCFRKVSQFRHFYYNYEDDIESQQKLHNGLTQFECMLRELFFNCIKAQTKSTRIRCNRPDKRKKFKRAKEKIAKLLWDTRLCISNSNFNN